jgi:hypothetical protein
MNQSNKRSPEPGRCVCGHKMHSLKEPHACWQHQVIRTDGKPVCSCTEFRGSDGQKFDQNYYRGGVRLEYVLPNTTQRPFPFRS